jgi:hypothetical protein
MSKQAKDFEYYAAQAEHQLQLSLGRDEDDQPLMMSSEAKTRHVARAHVYALLAVAAAPKAEPVPKSQFFYFVNGQRVEGARCFAQRFTNPLVDPANSQCVHNYGHDGCHTTANGTCFDAE